MQLRSRCRTFCFVRRCESSYVGCFDDTSAPHDSPAAFFDIGPARDCPDVAGAIRRGLLASAAYPTACARRRDVGVLDVGLAENLAMAGGSYGAGPPGIHVCITTRRMARLAQVVEGIEQAAISQSRKKLLMYKATITAVGTSEDDQTLSDFEETIVAVRVAARADLSAGDAAQWLRAKGRADIANQFASGSAWAKRSGPPCTAWCDQSFRRQCARRARRCTSMVSGGPRR